MIESGSLETLGRKEYQRQLNKKRQRRRKQRRARMRRIRALRAVRSLRFWTRAITWLAIGLSVAFWSRFAFVYNIPSFAQIGSLQGVESYVTVKPWWFGPPVFDIESYVESENLPEQTNLSPYPLLLMQLGRYQAVLTHPHFVWVALDQHS
ncbi:hypothetical protein ACOJUR_01035 [Alicyclobacillus tolerans]|uniref:Uncharacterized protein n=1 Tax=Alicyclobacillus tolerans TaxID=90970 RepID=A0ABT9LUD5_9BACL|nr:hypothetical protein [Alicyclobacillus tengchongensis]MDP9727878.1 hypothetical protein [Alicyclobacillus tengchongensis]